MTRRPIRIANCSGFFGDRITAAAEQVEGGDIDVLTGDWLAELTMLILARQRLKHGMGSGYARTFLTQMKEVLSPCLERGIKVVSNAGGLDPDGCAARLGEIAAELGLEPRIAVVTGDDLIDRRDVLAEMVNLDTGETLAHAGLHPLAANAYLGSFGITKALADGADIVITGRVTDAALVVGPAAWWHGWDTADLDPLAGAVAAGHVIECGTQATGGNYAFFQEIPDLLHAGFPIAEIDADGSSVITKHPGTGGAVSVGTVTAQLLYEVAGPQYLGPDVVAHFDALDLEQVGPDRVRISGVAGSAAPDTLKVAINCLGGFRNSMSLVLTGPDRDAKAELVLSQLADVLDWVDESDVKTVQMGEHRTELRLSVKDQDKEKVGRGFSNAVVELTLASYPGMYPTAPPSAATPYGVYWPTVVPTSDVEQVVTLDGEVVARLPGGSGTASLADVMISPRETRPPGPTAGHDTTGPSIALGDIAGARSGDKGGNANIGVWVKDAANYEWLVANVTAEWVAHSLPGAAGCQIDVYDYANLNAVNIVVHRYLGRGVAENTNLDPQAKGIGELLRGCPITPPQGAWG